MIADNSTGDIACDSYHLWPQDIQNMRTLGVHLYPICLLEFAQVKAYRLSISWTRIFPNSTPGIVNELGVQYYMTLIDALRAANIEPMVSCY